MYLGDFKEDGDIFFKFTTRAFATGVPTTLAGSPVLSVYKDEGGAATEKTTAEAYFDLDVDHDSIVGWHNVRIDLSGDAFFATGADYSVVITTGTVDSVNVFGENLANFSIENRSMGQPAGATLAADIAAIKSETALIVADTNELQTDDVPGLIVTLDAVVDTVKAETALIVADTNELQTDDVPGLIATLDTVVDTVKAETALIVADTNELQTDDIPGTIAALNDIAAADVWAVDATGQQTQGTFGQAIGDPGIDADTIYGAVVTGAAGANIAVDIIAVKAETALIVDDTDLIDDGTSGLAKIATDVAAVLVDTAGLNGDVMRGTDSAATAANLATVDTVVDAIKVVTDKLDAADSEPTGVPAANETPLAKLAYLFMMARNKVTVTASKKTYFGDDDVAEFEKDLSDDATTYTETEINVI